MCTETMEICISLGLGVNISENCHRTQFHLSWSRSRPVQTHHKMVTLTNPRVRTPPGKPETITLHLEKSCNFVILNITPGKWY